jgi:hypothetical protein
VLFSDEQVAAFIQKNFEPVWEMVRPVPTVHIDFGNGKVLTRTLHGNIATYVCAADGQILDILPGIYTKTAYLTQLNQFQLLAHFVDQNGKGQRAVRMKDYHTALAAALEKNQALPHLVNLPVAVTKARIENPLMVVLMPTAGGPGPAPSPVAARQQQQDRPRLESADDVATWKTLAEDTQLNETLRRRQIHEMLAKVGLVQPKEVTRRIYRDVLHSDLDDPYLGLGPTLFASYPFKAEDARHGTQ